MNLPETLNVRVSKPDFHCSVLLVLVHLASYHNYMDQMHQQKLIRCLMMCTTTAAPRTQNSLKHCISALTICTLEMKEAMVKLLPEVLLNLSQKSATVHIAIPVLEFLSSKYINDIEFSITFFVSENGNVKGRKLYNIVAN